MNLNKNKIFLILLLTIGLYSITNSNISFSKNNVLEVEQGLKTKQEEIKRIENEKNLLIENLNKEKKDLINGYIDKELEKIDTPLEDLEKLITEQAEQESKIKDLTNHNCGLEGQKNLEKIDLNEKCFEEIIEEEEVGFFKSFFNKQNEKNNIGKAGYTEDGKKIKFLLTQYFSPEYHQEHFKNTWINGKVTYAGNIHPTTEQERWKYFLADGVMQCGATWYNMPQNENQKNEIIQNVENGCLSPGIKPFYDLNGKEKNLYENTDAEKMIACDYSYIAEIANLQCDPKIYNSTPKEEWDEKIKCRQRINKELVIKIEGLGKVKCADTGNKINLAHFDIWMGIGEEALEKLNKGKIGEIEKSNYDYDIDGKKIEIPKNGTYAEVEIYKNGKKIY